MARGRRALVGCVATLVAGALIAVGGCGEGTRDETPRTGNGPPGEITNSIGMSFRLIARGTFRMGGSAYTGEEPVHKVTISRPFYLGVREVTQAQYEQVVGTNPSSAPEFKGPDLPVVYVSWHDAQAFCRKLSEIEGIPYRLPTEAEWEYACRAGTTTPFSFGPTLSADTQANYNGNLPYGGGPKGQDRRGTTPVGSFPANAWGLHDMHGNVLEWCQSLYRPYPYRAQDGREDLTATGSRVLRGGSWSEGADFCRSACRTGGTPEGRTYNCGFRVARPLP